MSDLGDGWRVEMEGRVVEHRFLDRALGELLGEDSSSVLGLVRRLLDAEPGSEI